MRNRFIEEENLKTYRDIKNVIDTARAEGKIEGKREGKREGKIEGKREETERIIKRCVEENMSPEIISKIVNLPITEVNKIIEKIKQ